MLTIRENLLETIKGGNPDRFVKQYEFMEMIMNTPITRLKPPIGGQIVNEWGITVRWPEGQIGAFPVHDEEHKLLKDVTKWKEVIKAPNIVHPAEDWKAAQETVAAIDRNEKFVTIFVAPGIFEHLHYFMGMEDAMMNFYEEPEAMHEIIDFLVEWEIKLADEFIKYLKPDALFHHDDWGSQINSFMAPEMFEEFIVPAYKKIYGHWKSNGVELIVHHNDSFSANLVPFMIDMGIDIWQGVVTTNNTPELIKKYGGKISFMGDIDSGVVDFPDWKKEIIVKEVERACKNCGKHYFIPCATQGGPGSSFPGVYDAIDEEIDRMSKELF
ncbi:uroporphyrinogen decarboxylase family protein [Alkalibacter mobilis]|uniref:uroporphyrinogen decarboxylase family protein n=1 Tax=Alkalibacter mobilis TaxID=2787712 RepID=UPI0018A08AA2|nr:uroporphyrinogen decarboxylase family protein [Alkalibacter mobilis]MBF7096990.1 uroporphyrinogen decarboxylase [Alkalibacter mobilis]